MPTTQIRFGTGWSKIRKALKDPEMRKRLEKEVGKATTRNGIIGRQAVKATIRARIPPPNARLTVLIKRSRTPLRDTGRLMSAITSQKLAWNKAEVGVLRGGSASGSSLDLFELAVLLHEGGAFRVTPAMRNMFRLLARVASGQADAGTLTGRALDLWERNPKLEWKPLRPGTTLIMIPPRPFMTITFAKLGLVMQMRDEWQKAVNRVFQQAAT